MADGFYRGRMDIKGACGCAWSYIEPGVSEDDETAIEARVRDEVRGHAARTGHAPTIVIVREEFFSRDLAEFTAANE